MSIEKRIENLEKRHNIKRSCTLLIMLSDGDEGPTSEQTDRYREHQRESGRCQDCSGFCVLDWMVEASGGKPQ